MFKIITSLFFSPSETSKKSYAYHKNPSAIDWAVTTLISTIYNNISFFYTAPKTEEDNAITQTTSLPQEESKEDRRKFPEDYATDLLKIHKMIAAVTSGQLFELESSATPEIREICNMLSRIKPQCPPLYITLGNYLPIIQTLPIICPTLRKNREKCEIAMTEALKQPITTFEQFRATLEKWFSLQKHWADFDDIYCVTKKEEVSTETQNDNPDTNSELYTHLYDQKAWSNAQNIQLREIRVMRDIRCINSMFKPALKSYLRDDQSLKNLILMLGLKYSFLIKTGLNCDCQVFHGSVPYYNNNSAVNILNDDINHCKLISTTLAHIATQRKILGKIDFLLTEDNVNCESYQGIHFIPQLTCEHNYFYDYYPHTLMILDTPLKIAVDNFDFDTFNLLLENGAITTHKVRATINTSEKAGYRYQMSRYALDPNKLLKLISFSDYFLELNPAQVIRYKDINATEQQIRTQQTTSYIKIADLLYRSLPPGEEKNNFLNKAAKKKLTIYSESTGISTDEVLLNLLSPRTQSKSARNVDHEETLPNIHKKNETEEPAATELYSTTPAQQLPSSGEFPLPDIQEEEIKKVEEHSAGVNNITPDMNSTYYNTTLPNITGSASYDDESHVNLAGYQAFSANNHLTIEYH